MSKAFNLFTLLLVGIAGYTGLMQVGSMGQRLFHTLKKLPNGPY